MKNSILYTSFQNSSAFMGHRTAAASLYQRFLRSLFRAAGVTLLGGLCLSASAQTNFGTVAIGKSSTATVTITMASTVTLGSVSVVTQGEDALDFTNAGGGSCSVGSTYAKNATCTVDVDFTPTVAGVRYGAAVARNASGTAVAISYLQGAGQGPQAAYLPGTKTDVEDSAKLYPRHLAADTSGNVYMTSYMTGTLTVNDVFEMWAQPLGGYGQLLLSSSLSSPWGIAVDGSGILYVSSYGFGNIYRLIPTSSGYTSPAIIASGFTYPKALAVDGSGNVYISDSNGIYKEALYAGKYTKSTVVSGLSGTGLAVDSSGNVYAASGSSVYKETLTNGSYIKSTVGSGWSSSSDIAIDGSGNLYVADGGTVYRVVLSDGKYTKTAVASTSSSASIALDGSGNLYYADLYGYVYQVDLADPPSLSFATTAYGFTSTDSPQTATLSNIGNAALKVASVSYPTDFSQSSTPTGYCKAGISLAAGANCTMTISFKPVTSGELTEAVKVTDNTLNVTGTTQSITVSGTGTTPPVPVFSPVAGSYYAAQTVTLSDTLSGVIIYYTTNGSTPTTASTKYKGPITVSVSEKLQAIAVVSTSMQSAVASATYTLVATPPTFSPAAGVYGAGQTVKLSDATPGEVIYYTVDGTTPTTSSNLYSGPITVTSSEIIQAVAAASGYSTSAVATAAYSLAGKWTWVGGSKTQGASGVYGSIGKAAAANIPGARGDTTGWKDSSGNLWLFGGGTNSDLWKFDISTSQWTWVSGSKTSNSSGVYGTEGQAANSNVPGARNSANSWIDSKGISGFLGEMVLIRQDTEAGSMIFGSSILLRTNGHG